MINFPELFQTSYLGKNFETGAIRIFTQITVTVDSSVGLLRNQFLKEIHGFKYFNDTLYTITGF